MVEKPFTVAAIPAFDEESTIAKVVARAAGYVDRVIVVDDGSDDDTSLIAEKLGATVIRHERNMGKGEALRSIFKAARDLEADVLVTLDADGQHDAREIPALTEPVVRGEADVVIGSRYIENKPSAKGMPRYRKIGLEATDDFVRRLGGLSIKDTQSGFRAYSRKAIQDLMPVERSMAVDSELLLRAKERGLSLAEVFVTASYELPRTSKHNPVYHALQVVSGVVKFISLKHPLLFYGIPGVILLLAGTVAGYLVAELYLKTLYFSVPFTLLAAILILSGLLLIFTATILFTLISVLRERS